MKAKQVGALWMGERRLVRGSLQLPGDTICGISMVKLVLFLGSCLHLIWGAPHSAPELPQPDAAPAEPTESLMLQLHQERNLGVWEPNSRKEPNSGTRPQRLDSWYSFLPKEDGGKKICLRRDSLGVQWSTSMLPMEPDSPSPVILHFVPTKLCW